MRNTARFSSNGAKIHGGHDFVPSELLTVALRAEQIATLAKILGVPANLLLRLETAKPYGTGPAGKMRQDFRQAETVNINLMAGKSPFVRE
jgi:hypothetical protein